MRRGLILLILVQLGCSPQIPDRTDIFVKFSDATIGQPITSQTMPFSNNKVRYISYQGNLYEFPSDYEKIPYEFMLSWMNPKVAERKWIHEGQIQLLVDTENSLDDNTYIYPPDDLPAEEIRDWMNSHKITVSAFPVYILNTSDKVASIEVDEDRTTMIQEARDADGSWKPIEHKMVGPFCGNGHSDFVIPQNSFLIVSAYKYQGDFTTDLRIKLEQNGQVYYSNTYRGQVSTDQFVMSNELKEYDARMERLEGGDGK